MSTPGPHAEPFAVVELFTSEGCSSCPPADAFLAELSQMTPKNRRIFPLSFHVDYWNRLGWEDPFSNSAFTYRQRTYSYLLGTFDVFTPQMYVNGQEGFNGANRKKAVEQIKKALNQPPQVSLVLAVYPGSAKDSIVVHYEVSQVGSDQILYLVLIERGLVSKILSGENAGLVLHHENVVRAFKSVRLTKNRQGKIDFALSEDVKKENFAVIGYVQNTKTMAIIGAEKVEIGS